MNDVATNAEGDPSGKGVHSACTQTDSLTGQTPRLSKVNLFTLFSLWMELFPSVGEQNKLQVKKAGLVVVKDMKIIGLHCSSQDLHVGQIALIKYGSKLKNCDLYFSRKPCSMCLKMIVNAGVNRISYWPADPEISLQYEISNEDAKLDAKAVERLKSNSRAHVCVLLQPLICHMMQFVEESCLKCDFIQKTAKFQPGMSTAFYTECRQQRIKEYERLFLISSEEIHKKILVTLGLENLCENPYFSNLRQNMKDLVLLLATIAASVPSLSDFGFYCTKSESTSETRYQKLPQEIARHCMVQARLLAYRSEDHKIGVGAVIWAETNAGSCDGTGALYFIGCGYNAFPVGSEYADFPHMDDKQKDREIRKFRYIIHAEQNALTFRCQEIKPDERSMIFVTKCPCDECVPLIKGAGIKLIYTGDVDVGRKKADISYLKFAEQEGVRKFTVMLSENTLLLLMAIDFLPGNLWSSVWVLGAVMSGFVVVLQCIYQNLEEFSSTRFLKTLTNIVLPLEPVGGENPSCMPSIKPTRMNLNGSAALAIYYSLLHPKSTGIWQHLLKKTSHAVSKNSKGTGGSTFQSKNQTIRSPGISGLQNIEVLSVEPSIQPLEMPNISSLVESEGSGDGKDPRENHRHWLLIKLALKTGSTSKINAAFREGDIGNFYPAIVMNRKLSITKLGPRRKLIFSTQGRFPVSPKFRTLGQVFLAEEDKAAENLSRKGESSYVTLPNSKCITVEHVPEECSPITNSIQHVASVGTGLVSLHECCQGKRRETPTAIGKEECGKGEGEQQTQVCTSSTVYFTASVEKDAAPGTENKMAAACVTDVLAEPEKNSSGSIVQDNQLGDGGGFLLAADNVNSMLAVGTNGFLQSSCVCCFPTHYSTSASSTLLDQEGILRA